MTLGKGLDGLYEVEKHRKCYLGPTGMVLWVGLYKFKV